VHSSGDLERGRAFYAGRAWRDAFESLSSADRRDPLGAEDLEQLATSAAMLGRDDDYLALLERAHHAYLDAGETLSAVRCAFWVGTQNALRGDLARATGWLGRAHRLVEREGDCVERGYLLLPVMIGQGAAGDYEAAAATATEAAGIAERFGEADLFALAVHEHGCVLIRQGQIERGAALLDEVTRRRSRWGVRRNGRRR